MAAAGEALAVAALRVGFALMAVAAASAAHSTIVHLDDAVSALALLRFVGASPR